MSVYDEILMRLHCPKRLHSYFLESVSSPFLSNPAIIDYNPFLQQVSNITCSDMTPGLTLYGVAAGGVVPARLAPAHRGPAPVHLAVRVHAARRGRALARHLHTPGGSVSSSYSSSYSSS